MPGYRRMRRDEWCQRGSLKGNGSFRKEGGCVCGAQYSGSHISLYSLGLVNGSHAHQSIHCTNVAIRHITTTCSCGNMWNEGLCSRVPSHGFSRHHLSVVLSNCRIKQRVLLFISNQMGTLNPTSSHIMQDTYLT